MLERPNYDTGQPEDALNVVSEHDAQSYSKGSQKVETNQNFAKSIQELQLFFEKFHGTHSER